MFMKTLLCSELGGECDEVLAAESWGDMVKAMTAHVMDNHPDTAKAMAEMHAKEPEAWGKEHKSKWDEAEEVDPSEEKEDESQLPEENEMAKENMHGQNDDDSNKMEDPNAPRIIEDQ